MARMAEPVARSSAARAHLPGDQWREFVSPGALAAYDQALAPARAEARSMRRRGRLVAASRREERARKIRARGYDRARIAAEAAEEPVGKGYERVVTRVGPYTRSSTTLRLRRPTKSEARSKALADVARALGGARTLAVLGVGAGTTAAVKERLDSSKAAAAKRIGTMRGKDEERTNLMVTKTDNDLVDIAKAFGVLGRLVGSYARSAESGLSSGGLAGARRNVQRVATHTGGVGGLMNAAAQTAGTPGAKRAAGLGAGLIGAGAGALGARNLARASTKKVKRKALKYAGIGAAGLGGTVAAGTAAGNLVSD